MAYSQQTTHYGLPLPTSGDKSTFLDTNDAFGRIDSDIYEAKTNATAAVQDIGQIQLDVSQLKASTLEMQTDISQLTSRQTISETNITSLQSAMSTAQADVTKLQNDYGNTDISAIGDGTVTGAIDHLNDNLTVLTRHTASVTTTGSGYVQLTTDHNVPTTSKIIGLTAQGTTANPNLIVVTPWQQSSGNWITRIEDQDGNPIASGTFTIDWLQID